MILKREADMSWFKTKITETDTTIKCFKELKTIKLKPLANHY